MSNIEIIGLGALNVDNIYQVERILEDGETVVNEAKSFPGGSAANSIYGLAKLSVKTGFTGVIGDDAEGKILLQDFQKVGVDTSQIKVKPQTKTGSVLCLSDKPGRRSLYVLPGANSLLSIDDLDLTYINQAKILHLSSFANDEQFKVTLTLVGRLSSSVKLSFAPGTLYTARGLRALSPILDKTDVLFVNHDEVLQLTGKEVIAGAKSCLKYGCHTVAVTLGKGMELELGRGRNRKTVTASCYIRDANKEFTIEPASQNTVTPVDTTGAGDAFATGFLHGLLNGMGLEDCGRLGDIVAQFCITKIGARQGFPTLKMLTKRYQELYNK